MRRFLPLLLFLIFQVDAVAAESDRPKGRNCTLTAPPAAAGEESNHGMTLRVHPRAREIDSKYTGCQVVWAPDGKKWVAISVVSIESGSAVRIWIPDDPGSEVTACRYANGQLVAGSTDICAPPAHVIMKSLAPGCVAKIQESVIKQGLDAPLPRGCSYE